MSAPNYELISAVAKAICDGTLPNRRANFAESPHWYISGNHFLSGDHTGFDDICRVASALRKACKGTYIAEFQKAVADDDHGYALLKSTAHTRGQEIKSWFLLGFRIKDGKVDAMWTFPYDQSVETRMFATTSDNSDLVALRF